MMSFLKEYKKYILLLCLGLIIIIPILWMILFSYNLSASNPIPFEIGLLLSFASFLLLLVFLNFKYLSVSEHFGVNLLLILLITMISTIILTILLVKQLIPNYFNSIYILFGSMIVAIIGLYLNKLLEKDKEVRKIRRLFFVVSDTININKEIAETLISTKWAGIRIDTLKKGYWDIFRSNIIEVDLEPELVRDLVSLKEFTYEINKLIIERNNYLVGLTRNIPSYLSITEICDGEDLEKLDMYNKHIKSNLKEFIKKSSGFIDDYKDF